MPNHKLGGIALVEDNDGTKALAGNPLSSPNSKYIDVRHQLLRELVSKGDITITHASSRNQHDDILTKALAREEYLTHRDSLSGVI